MERVAHDFDLIIEGGTVVTMNPERAVVRADVLVKGGRIVRIAEKGERIEGRARVIDARGALVVPGFVQTHVHLCQALFRGMADELPLMDWLRQRIWPLEAAHTEASIAASARLGIAEMLLGGTTTILDMGTVSHQDVVFDVLKESGLRAFSGKAMMDKGFGVPEGLCETTKDSLRESERLIAKWHGTADGRLGYALAPRFILSCSEKLWRQTAELALATKTLIHSHAAEHVGERDEVRRQLGMDDVDALASYGIAGPHVVLAHGVQLTKAQMKRCAKQGTRFVHCPSANLKLSSGIADVVAMRNAGMIIGLGADGAPCNNRMDAFTELRQAALLAKVKRMDAAALSPMDALAMLTIDGARVLGIDKEVGSIEVGKKADISVVRIDALHALPGIEGNVASLISRLVYSATPRDVTDVIVDGIPLVERGVLRAFDEAQVAADAVREGRGVFERARIAA